jgi:putative phosphoribosyl transferase
VRFADRREAGRLLAERLADVRGDEPIVYGIPRGGVVVADEIATRLDCDLEVLIVRKLGYPGHEEAAFGALGEEGALAPEALAALGPGDPGYDVVSSAMEQKGRETTEQIRLYRGGRERLKATDRTAVVVDDGIATGYTFAAALAIVARDRPRRLIAAIPVATVEGSQLAARYADEVRLLQAADPSRFFAVSMYYDRFEQVSDDEVIALLSREPDGGAASEDPGSGSRR